MAQGIVVFLLLLVVDVGAGVAWHAHVEVRHEHSGMDARVAGREGAAKGVALLRAGGGGLHVNAEEVEGGRWKVKQ